MHLIYSFWIQQKLMLHHIRYSKIIIFMITEQTIHNNLIPHIFTTYSNRSFLPKYCEQHIDQHISLICLNCVQKQGESFCPKCFQRHHCDAKQQKSLGSWMAEQRQKVTKNIQKIHKKTDLANGFRLSGFKINTLGMEGKTISQINNSILIRLNKQLEQVKSQIDSQCVNLVTRQIIPNKFNIFHHQITQHISGLTSDLRSVLMLDSKVQQISHQFSVQIDQTIEQMKKECVNFYKDGTVNILDGIRQGLMNDKNQEIERKKEILSSQIYEERIKKLQKELQNVHKQLNQISIKFMHVNLKLTQSSDMLQKRERQYEEMIDHNQEKMQQLLQKIKLLQDKPDQLYELQKVLKQKQRQLQRQKTHTAEIDQLLSEQMIKNSQLERKLKQKKDQIQKLKQTEQKLSKQMGETQQKNKMLAQQLDFIGNTSMQYNEKNQSIIEEKQKSIVQCQKLRIKIEELQEQIFVLKEKLVEKDIEIDSRQLTIKQLLDQIQSMSEQNNSIEIQKSENDSPPSQKGKSEENIKNQQKAQSGTISSTNIKKKAIQNGQESKNSTKGLQSSASQKNISSSGPSKKNGVNKFKELIGSPKNKGYEESEKNKKLMKKNRNFLNKNKE